MKTKIIAALAMLLVAVSAWADCPTTETTVVFMNGVGTRGDDAKKYTKNLSHEVYAKGISPSCLHFALSHTQNDGFLFDAAEAILQKSVETGVAFSRFVRMLLRLIPGDSAFEETLALIYGSPSVGNVFSPQVDRHVANLKSLALDLGHNAILVTHSQGGLYANAVYARLTEEEKARTHIVTVATPASEAADGGPNTRLARDGAANLFFVFGSLQGIVHNEERSCAHENRRFPDSWLCHGFDTGYSPRKTK